MKRKIDTKGAERKLKRLKKEEGKPKILSVEEREKRKTSLYRAPTSEELSELKENESLYKNNLFRMQIGYLLEEVTMQEKKTKKINDVLHSLNEYLKDQLSAQEEEHELLSDACIAPDIQLPLPSLIESSKIKGKFQFVPPEEIKVIGSYLLKTMTKPNHVVDIAVEIPKSFFQPRDSINYRYLYKRACYMTWVASALQSWDHTENVQFYSTNDIYKPLIQLTLKGKVGKRYSVRLYITIPMDTFKLNRFAPLKNNVRSNWYEGLDNNTAEDLEFPTPVYNSSILSDMLYEKHLHVLYDSLKECPGIKDAICLFKVWLQQRAFKGVITFNGFIGSMLLAYLLSSRFISPQMSSYQIFRLLLNFLATSDLSRKGISLCKEQEEKVPTKDFHAVFDVVFVDQTGYLNLMANVDNLTYTMVKDQAKISLEILDNISINAFECLFIKRHHFLQSVDHCFRLSDLEGLKEKLLEDDKSKFSVMDQGGDWTKLISKKVISILHKGLADRVKYFIMKPAVANEWCVTSVPSDIRDEEFWFGIGLNAETCDQLLIMGPPADQPQAKEFRELWGSQSELRRFQDGSINEAVVFKCTNLTERKMITKKIVHHLLQLHCNITSSSISYHGDEANPILHPKYVKPAEDSKSKVNPGCGEEENTHFIKVFEGLSKAIRNLNDLPLSINSIQGIDPVFRSTEVVLPRQCQTKLSSTDYSKSYLIPKLDMTKSPSWCSANKVIIQFETSGKWPDDIDAIQHIKAAFQIKLAKLIREQLKCPTVATPAYTDVIKNGYVFRFVVVHYREMMLHKECEGNSVILKQHEEQVKELDIIIVKKPVHTTLIHGLNARFLAYGPTVRLSKRWISSQLLSDFLSEEAIELIVAYMFLKPEPLQVPTSPMCGFLRFLNLMATFDWLNEPLIVDINDQITNEQYTEIKENFTSSRQRLPPMFITTNYDISTSVWTKHAPSQQILRRTSLLATASSDIIDNNCENLSDDLFKQIFRASFEDYNVVIELNKSFIPLHHYDVDTSLLTKPLPLKENIRNDVIPVTQFNPVDLYISELKEAFSEIALFFYDKYGGTKIGIVWKKEAYEKQPFKILNAKYKTLVKPSKKKKKKSKEEDEFKETLAKVNIKAILSDFHIIGQGLVKEVHEKS